jgi:glucose-6-phosphate-specific signal transduction histidine kinase
VAASITQTAKQQCPALANDATKNMLDNVTDLLKSLRLAELDELGLAANLIRLISGWNAGSQVANRPYPQTA